MAIIRKKELLKIFYRIAKALSPNDITWLKANLPNIWGNFTHLEGQDASYSEWEINNLYNVFFISFRIQNMIDAKLGKHLIEKKIFAEGLPKLYLVEIAKLFGIVSKDIDSHAVKMNKWQLVNAILEKC